jgi:exodeoxyribonuclease-3
MRIATWNVNSVRARLPRVLDWLASRRPEVACLQEIKCLDEQFPRAEIEALGYRVETFGQKTYNGVALLALQPQPLEDLLRWRANGSPDGEARVIAATLGDLRLVNAYVVNGQAVGTPKYDYKLTWLQRFGDLVQQEHAAHRKLVIVGDFNITFDDRDVYDPVEWHEKILCSTPERQALTAVMSSGLRDAFRHFTQEGGHYTYWDFYTRGFQRGNGLRIDHVLMSDEALASCTEVRIDIDARKGEKPSDHAPVIATFA